MKTQIKKQNNETVRVILNNTTTELNIEKLQKKVNQLVPFYGLDLEQVLNMTYKEFRKQYNKMLRDKNRIAEEIKICTEIADFFDMEATEVFKLNKKELNKLVSRMRNKQYEQRRKDYETVANFLMNGNEEEVIEFVKNIDWDKFSSDNYRFMDIEFIRKFRKYIDFKYFMWNCRLSADFMNEFRDKLDFSFLYNTDWFRPTFYIRNGIVYETK